MTLYLKFGGRPAFAQAMNQLMQRLRVDPDFSRAAADISIKHQDDLCEFLIFLTGGSPIYENTPVSELLSALCQTDRAFDAFVDHFAAALKSHNVPVEATEELRSLMEKIRCYAVSDHDSRENFDRPAADEMVA
ncbi:Clp protease ClpP [Roseibium algae]|uniref:Clp protease ClpP n=1 Tax=Roseibium algae TaxID=3123038 RepID=A0ABU8TRD2_9HYPH